MVRIRRSKRANGSGDRIGKNTMSTLILTPNIPNGDDFYEKLLNAHEGLSKEQSDALNARLILVLSNHIGDIDILEQALDAAKTAGQAA
jgi:hypothetical protein